MKKGIGYTEFINLEVIMFNKYKIRLIVGSILFGIIVFGNEVFEKGTWNWRGLLWVLYGAVGFGILFHFLFNNIIKEYEVGS